MPDDISSLRAHAHPVRLQILSLLTGAPMSAAEVSRELGLTHANASYHLRVLAAAGEIVDAGEERIRGGRAKRYRHPWDRPADRCTPRKVRGGAAEAARAEEGELFVQAMAQELLRRIRLRRPRTRSLMTDADLWVSQDTWVRVTALVEEASRLVHSDARAPRSTGTVHVNLSAALFELRR